jgi:hypothetical protein
MRRTIWKALLDAELNVRYWKKLVQRYTKYDQFLKIFLAAISSGAVAGWSFWGDYPWAWKILSSLSALVAIALPTLNFPKQIESMSLLSSKWFELKIEYEEQWRKLEDGSEIRQIESAYNRTKKQEAILVLKETKLPHDEQLLRQCFNEVKQSYGI